MVFFVQAEDGIRDAQESRGLGDVYKRQNISYTSIFNLTGSPVVVIPIGYTKEGMPIGVQIVGKRWRDMELLTMAEQLDKIAAAYRRPEGY